MRPILFFLGSIPVYAYGTLVAVAFLIGLWAVGRSVQRNHVASFDNIIDMGLWILIGGIAGARILFVLLELKYYLAHPVQIIMINQGGLSFYGSLIGGYIGGVWYAKRQRLAVWPIADLMAPWLALGYSIVRVGCLLNGCCYGLPTQISWAMRCSAEDNLLRHPTQIYALVASLIIFFILKAAEKRKPFHGFIFWLYIGIYAVARYIIEIYRDSQILAFGWLRTTQVACIALVLLAGWKIYRGYQRKERVETVGGEDTISAGE